jgi:ATP-dependent DNA helicase PIF1
LLDDDIAEAFRVLGIRHDVTTDEVDAVFGRLVGEALNAGKSDLTDALNKAKNTVISYLEDLNREANELMRYFDETDHNIFVLGRAGTGKSKVLSDYLARGRENVAACAFTGVAARNIDSPTIHSLFRVSGGPGELKGQRNLDEATKSVLAKIKILFIDEISMAPGWLIDEVDKKLREANKSDRPFGGVRVIFVGDPLQLAPFVGNDAADAELKKWVTENYPSYWFFDSKVFNNPDFEFKMFEIKEVRRQDKKTQGDFVKILDNVRLKTLEPGQLSHLNTRVLPKPKDDEVLTIATTNAAVEAVNKAKMDSLPTTEVRFFGSESSLADNEKFVIPGNPYPVPQELVLKVGAQVMFTKNDDQNAEGLQKRWVNGTLGIITAFSEDSKSIFVRIDDDVPVEVGTSTWSRFKYKIEEVEDRKTGRKEGKLVKRAVAEYTQVPLSPAWSVTVNKSQGSTYVRVHVDLGNRAFAPGQTYVALSRVRTFEGLTLERPVTDSDIIVANEADVFIKECILNRKIEDSDYVPF